MNSPNPDLLKDYLDGQLDIGGEMLEIAERLPHGRDRSAIIGLARRIGERTESLVGAWIPDLGAE